MFARTSLRWIRVSAFLSAILLIVLLSAAAAARPARVGSRPVEGGDLIRGGLVGAGKAAGDTVLLMGPHGSGAPYIGTFESAAGQPDWNGWAGRDESVGPPNPWHVDTYNVVSGVYSAWCGDARFPSCSPEDPAGGYGNGYRAALEWRGAVADPALPCTVTVSALANVDVEPWYDSASLRVETAAGALELWTMGGYAPGVSINDSHVYQPGDYVGPGGDEVVVRFVVRSDAAWSDEDCLWAGQGAMQLDDVIITLSNGDGASHDFEDGTLGPFTTPPAVGVGDFAAIWTGLEDEDPCRTNYTPQVAFIDDGLVVPGTGGSPCINWCYGPNGWIVNTRGGLAGPTEHLHSAVLSPAIAWPGSAADGAVLSFDVYEHEEYSPDAPGIYWTWAVRSAPGNDPADLEAAPWRDRGEFYKGRANYERRSEDVSDLLVPGLGQIQVRLAAYEWGWFWNIDGDDGYPAPYFDNVRLAAYPFGGPALAASEIDLAQDAFPAAGAFDPGNPGAAAVRFDAAVNMTSLRTPVVAGDSLVITAASVRSGAVMTGPPRLHYRLARNPDFDPWRGSGLPDVGSVACDTARSAFGTPLADRWSADLPDAGFLFPGDVLHYYFSATDDVAGDVRTAIMPADTSGFSDMTAASAYDWRFTVRALPSLRWGSGPVEHHDQPRGLVWFDAAAPEVRARWGTMLDQLCLEHGGGIDIFTSRAAASDGANGLGAKATPALLADYDMILYTSGKLAANTLGDGGASGAASADLPLLAAWLDLGGKGLYAGGDNLATDMRGSVLGSAFLSDRFGVRTITANVRSFISNQVAPTVLPVSGNGIFTLTGGWRLAAGCPTVRTVDGVQAYGTGVRAAEFASPQGLPGGYSFAAAVRNTDPASDSRCLLTPYDLALVENVSGGDPGAGLLTGTVVLRDIIAWTGRFAVVPECPSSVLEETPRARFGAEAYPNPFNPRIRIDYAVARPGRLTVTVYDLRGRLVRTLLDGPVESGGFLEWDGTDARGARAASGVYFYEARMHGESRVGRMTLLK